MSVQVTKFLCEMFSDCYGWPHQKKLTLTEIKPRIEFSYAGIKVKN